LRLLPADAWDEHYRLMFDLRLVRAQVLTVLGRVDEAEGEFTDLLARATTPFDRAVCCDVRSEALHSAGRPVEAYAAGRAGLEQLGVHFPTTPEEAAEETAALLAVMLDPTVIGRLERLDEGDAEAMLAGSVFWRALIGSYWTRPADMPLVVGKHVEYALRTGLTPHVAVSLGFIGVICVFQGHLEMAIGYGEAGLAMAERFNDPFFRGRAGLVGGLVTALKQPFAVSEAGFEELVSVCFSVGDLEFVNHCMITTYQGSLAAGRDCPATLERCEQWLDFCRNFVPLEEGQARIRAAALRRLMAVEPRPSDAEPFDAEAIIDGYEEQGDVTDVCESLMELVRIETLFGDYEAAYRHGVRAEPPVDAGASGVFLINYLFWMHYAIAAGRVGDLGKVDHLLSKMEPFARLNPDNFRSYYTLAAAERARATGDADEAAVGYVQTIEHAGTHGYILLEAFANELLARHYRDRGHRFALAHFQEARALYLECGARGKAVALEEEIPELRRPAPASSTRGLGLFVTPTTERGSAHLDLDTALKASLAIAGEIALDRVVERLVAISIENAGAERGVFVSVERDALRVEAEGVAGGAIRRQDSRLLNGEEDVVPAGLVRTAARTGEPVVLPDALVLPIVRKGETSGVLYLENRLVSGAFTPERLALLEVLSGQMAISLENALLYAHLEEKVADRTRELSDA
ncbi:MAG TPA: GAF domain-containing protein, partial [Acidimicrobiia bacterium]|nr:GAF domain-containing protein [Acidimicrobiia bacterium]